MPKDDGIVHHRDAKYDVKSTLITESERLRKALEDRNKFLEQNSVGKAKARDIIMATADVKYFEDAITQVEDVLRTL